MNFASRRVKIVATVGPSSSDPVTLENLIKAGVNVMRLNFSHGSHEDHSVRYKAIRDAAKRLGRHVAILQDLQGPKLRVGKFANGVIQIDKGENIILRLEANREFVAKTNTQPKIIPYNYEHLAKEVRAGHRILMDDGNMEVVVTDVKGSDIHAQVIFGGELKNHKGMNFPDTRVSVESFTPKDREDLLFGLQLGVDYVAMSFVRSANDVRTVQKFMHAHRKNIPVVAKIEKAEAITNLIEILEVTDAVMVARGDLAVETGTAQVPSYQKKIIRECRKRGIPVITATQMLESMINSPRPTRAEASDVANAVLDGTDAVMLSAESASGKFPVLAVSVMHNIILETERRKETYRVSEDHFVPDSRDHTLVEAIEHSASTLAAFANAKAIVCTTQSGTSARALAKFRPMVPIIAFTDHIDVARRLALVWGTESVHVDQPDTLEEIFEMTTDKLLSWGVVQKNDVFILTTGWPSLKHGTTNLLKVVIVRKDPEKKESTSKPGEPEYEKNVEGYKTLKAQFILDQNLCIQCGGCVEVCPNDIFGMENRKVFLKEPNCKNCAFDDACILICPTSAIEIIQIGG